VAYKLRTPVKNGNFLTRGSSIFWILRSYDPHKPTNLGWNSNLHCCVIQRAVPKMFTSFLVPGCNFNLRYSQRERENGIWWRVSKKWNFFEDFSICFQFFIFRKKLSCLVPLQKKVYPQDFFHK
jgi:hypothetical protein